MSESNIEENGGLSIGIEPPLITEDMCVKTPLTGDWVTFERVQIERPNNYDSLSNEQATDILDQAIISLRRVAGMKEELREQFDDLSEKCMLLRDKIKNGDLSVSEALKQLDGKKDGAVDI